MKKLLALTLIAACILLGTSCTRTIYVVVSPSPTLASTPEATPVPTFTPVSVTFAPIYIEGQSSTTTAPFMIPTKEWSIKWGYIAENNSAIFSFFVYPRGETSQYVESITSTNEGMAAQKGETYLYSGAGEYYVKVITANTLGWSLTISPPQE